MVGIEVRREWKKKALKMNELAETYFIEEKYFFADAINYAVSSEDPSLSRKIEKTLDILYLD